MSHLCTKLSFKHTNPLCKTIKLLVVFPQIKYIQLSTDKWCRPDLTAYLYNLNKKTLHCGKLDNFLLNRRHKLKYDVSCISMAHDSYDTNHTKVVACLTIWHIDQLQRTKTRHIGKMYMTWSAIRQNSDDTGKEQNCGIYVDQTIPYRHT